MKKVLGIAAASALAIAAVSAPAAADNGNGCPKGDSWNLVPTFFVIEGFDQGNYKDQNGDGWVCYRVPKGFTKNQGQGDGNGAEPGSWVVKDNTN